MLVVVVTLRTGAAASVEARIVAPAQPRQVRRRDKECVFLDG
jgi:hypothetical protein